MEELSLLLMNGSECYVQIQNKESHFLKLFLQLFSQTIPLHTS